MVFYVYAAQCMSTFAIVKNLTNTWKWANSDDNLYDFTCLYWIDISISNRFVNGIYLMEYIILSILFDVYYYMFSIIY